MSWDPPPLISGCRDGHPDRLSPADHPELGLVPARSSAWLGAVVLGVLIAVAWWLLPSAHAVIVAVLGLWWVVVGVVQVALGHRGRCALRRTVRWYFGPVGALLDPFDDD